MLMNQVSEQWQYIPAVEHRFNGHCRCSSGQYSVSNREDFLAQAQWPADADRTCPPIRTYGDFRASNLVVFFSSKNP
jgi:hypothetical protein